MSLSSAASFDAFFPGAEPGASLLAQSGSKDGITHPACRLAAALVAAATGVAVAEILAPQRASATASRARQLAMYLAHVGFGLTQADVGRCFRRDRTTVAHACRRIEDQREGLFDQEVARLEACVRWVTEA